MKILRTLLIILFSSVLFYACKDNPVAVTPPGFRWQLHDSLPGENIEGIYTPDLYTLYTYNSFNCYKILYGTRTKIDFGDSTFYLISMNAYSPLYTAFTGTSGIFDSRVTLKIINNGVLTTTLLDSNPSALSSNIVILQPGKIVFTFEDKLYLYNNGTVTTYSAENKNEIFYRLVNSNDVFYASTFSGANENKTYKFQNNSLTLIETEAKGFNKMQVDNFLLRTTKTGPISEISYLASGGWQPFCSDSVNISFYEAAGENINSVYFLWLTSNEGFRGGSYWNGRTLVRDDKFPFKGNDPGFRIMSNMKTNTIYLSKYINGTSYIYKGFVPESY